MRLLEEDGQGGHVHEDSPPVRGDSLRRRSSQVGEPRSMTVTEIVTRLRRMGNACNVAGMARFGIAAKGTLGISIYDLRPLAREIGIDHRLARRLWATGLHEARILAGFIEDPGKMTEAQMERWVRDFDSWDVCDQVTEVFVRTPFAGRKIHQWARRDEEFVKRAAFAMISELAWHDKTAPDAAFDPFLKLIAASARWIASDALRELTGEAVQRRVRGQRRPIPQRTPSGRTRRA